MVHVRTHVDLHVMMTLIVLGNFISFRFARQRFIDAGAERCCAGPSILVLAAVVGPRLKGSTVSLLPIGAFNESLRR